MTVSTAVALAPVGQVLGTGLADFCGPVPAGDIWCIDIRTANSGTADGTVDLFLVDTNGVGVNHYRAKNFPVPFSTVGSAPDMEQKLVLSAGWKVQMRASAAATVTASMTGIQDVA